MSSSNPTLGPEMSAKAESPGPDTFDGYRFEKLRKLPGHEAKHQAVTTGLVRCLGTCDSQHAYRDTRIRLSGDMAHTPVRDDFLPFTRLRVSLWSFSSIMMSGLRTA